MYSSNTLQVNASPYVTPLLDVNNQSQNLGSQPNLGANLFKTPSNAFLQQHHTPLNSYRRAFTPHSSLNANKHNLNNTTIHMLNMENPCESSYEQMAPEYLLEFIWTEPVSYN